jgi:hypothetical protein
MFDHFETTPGATADRFRCLDNPLAQRFIQIDSILLKKRPENRLKTLAIWSAPDASSPGQQT